MLVSLSVKNFAIIENINIDFNEGMTVLTGETGAGKSLLIDAISLLLGERAQTNLVRKGFDKAIIEGLFYYYDKEINNILEENGIELNDNSLIIKREISSIGNSVIRINGSITTLNVLNKIGDLIADIHTQGDSYRIIKKNNYIKIIDNLGIDNNLLNTYQDLYSEYTNAVSKYKELKNQSDQTEMEIDYFKFQLEELQNANLNINEEEELQNELSKLENFDKIYSNIKEAYDSLNENSIDGIIYTSATKLEKITKFDESLKENSTQLLSLYYDLVEVMNNLKEKVSDLDFNPFELEKLQNRERLLNNLKRKYKKDIQELIEYTEELTDRINRFENKDYLLKKQYDLCEDLYNKLLLIANKITDQRIKISEKFSDDIIEFLSDLELKNTRFKVVFKERYNEDILNTNFFYTNGIDDIDFLISLNIGEDLLSLSKTASGGEMSRFMLALKAIILEKQNLSTIIFDEIDTGVSGEVALSIASKMKLISKNTQTLCITHLPQVAALSDNHLFIHKEEKDNRTITKIRSLSNEDRINEIAKMISGETVTNEALSIAVQLLQKKKQIL